MRFNDGAIDPVGRFFAGSMTDNELHEPINEGGLFRLDADRSVHKVLSPVFIPNGMGWSSDGKTMYFTDSPNGIIYAFDYNVETAEMTNRRDWFKLEGEPEGAAPDGFAIDEHGDIWSAIYGGHKVIRIRDENGKGKVVGKVEFPTRCMTCPRFVGTELIVTSAQDGEQDASKEVARDFGGRVFRVDVGVRGAPIKKWAGKI
jgi:sugar lactone lactonase YvrE